jgi:hypothetical protein
VSLVQWEPGTSHQKHEEFDPGSVERDSKKKAKQKRLEEAYAFVDKRDQNRSRVTGIYLDPFAVDPKERREHNHIEKRSLSKARREDPKNIHLCSAFEHDLITNGWITVEGTDADDELFFHWNDEFAKGRRPIVLKRWNPRALKQTGANQ